MKSKSKLIKYLLLSLCTFIVLAAVFTFALVKDEARIPKLYFEGDISNMETKTDLREITFRYVDGDRIVSGYAELKVQGTSSLAYKKKNYTIKLFQDEGHNDKMKVDFGWGEQSKYCLKANWVDRTHSRNVVTARLGAQVQAKYDLLTQAPCNGLVDGFPVEIYSNGFFHGLYTLNIPKDDWQFAMDSDNPTHLVVSGKTYTPTNLFQEEPDFNAWEVEVGQNSDENLERLSRMFSFVIDSTDEEFKEHFEEYLDLDAALNYYVMVDFCYLADNHGQNMLLASYDGMKWYLSLYDLDTSWGTNWNGYYLLPYPEEGLDMSRNNLFARMEKCFGKELAQRYFELREEILNKDHIMAEFETFRDQIPTLAFVKETLRWGQGLIRRPADIPGYDLAQIADYIGYAEERLDQKYLKMMNE